VVFCHAWQTMIVPAPGNAELASGPLATGIAIGGKFAVFTFFTLSGYVIALSAARNVAKHGTFHVQEFALARGFRILPPLLAVMAATVAIQLVLSASGMASTPTGLTLAREEYQVVPLPAIKCFITLCGTGTLVRDVNGPLWSLEAEVQLYVISGLLMWLTYNRKHRVLIAAALVIYLVMCFRPIRDGALTIQPASFAAFGCGWAMQRLAGVISTRVLALVTVAGTAAAAVFLGFASHEELLHMNGGVAPSAALIAFSIASASAIQLIAGRKTARWAVGTGAFSYTLYIFHFPLLLAASFVLFHRAPGLMLTHEVTVAIVAGCAVIAACALFGRLLEQPKAQQRFVMERVNRVLPRRVRAAPEVLRASEERPG
jgi:peptidoglycan/LPS O-acetylase OafA/YrhL